MEPTVDDLIAQRNAVAQRALDLELALVARDRRIKELEDKMRATEDIPVS